MRLGISSWTYAWAVGVDGYAPARPLRATGLLDEAARLGVFVVQICDNLPLHELSPADVSVFRRHAAGLNIALELGTRGLERGNLDTYLRLASSLHSPILRLVTDTTSHRPSEDEIVRRLRDFVPELRAAGVCLAIENHGRFPAGTLARIVGRIESEHVGVCLDTVNSFGALEGPEVVVETLAPWTVNLHIKDFAVLRAPQMMGFVIEGRPTGQGQLNTPWVLEILQRQGRDPNAIIELWTPPEPSVEGSIEKENAWAKASVAYLRTLISE